MFKQTVNFATLLSIWSLDTVCLIVITSLNKSLPKLSEYMNTFHVNNQLAFSFITNIWSTSCLCTFFIILCFKNFNALLNG